MVASGVPTIRENHAHILTSLAQDMINGLEEITPKNGNRMQFRFGIHSGPLMAGVIGNVRYQYDLWGDTVNIASRMESHGQPGKLHISSSTYDLIKDSFECIARGKSTIKGKGEMESGSKRAADNT